VTEDLTSLPFRLPHRRFERIATLADDFDPLRGIIAHGWRRNTDQPTQQS
jgi:hypothetical protein